MNKNEKLIKDARPPDFFIERVRQITDADFARTGKPRRAFIMTLGCQQNEADSEKLSGLSQAMGYEITDDPNEADLLLVNTCAVREHAEQKALSIVGSYKRLKAENPELVIGICGCMVSQDHRKEDIKHSYPYVDFVFGTSSIHRFPQILLEKLERGGRFILPEEEISGIAEGIPTRRELSHRAYVSIMYGCNNFCSYCIVPHVRGRERSRNPGAVFEEVESLVRAGAKDITLLGQNVNSYGKDKGDGFDFADMLAKLDTIEGDYLIHFMTSHPKDASHKLIDVVSESKHIAKHFHLPLQSGSDAVLKAMNRRYTVDKYLETVDYLQKKIPGITLTSDIIVGFPGESDADFEDTLSVLRRVGFDMIFSFIYSLRKGTPAAEMEYQVDAGVKRERMTRLLELQNNISLEKNRENINKVLRILCDGRSKNNEGMFSGRTEGNKIVLFEGDDRDTGNFVEVEIKEAKAFGMTGIKINQKGKENGNI